MAVGNLTEQNINIAITAAKNWDKK